MKPLLLSVLGIVSFLRLVAPASAASEPAASGDSGSARSTIVIVHGAWGAGYEWKEVGRQLHAAGHTVYRPTLTGMGERSHLSNPEIDLETHILTVDPGKKPEEDTFFRFYERARGRGWKLVVMEADHTPQFSRVTEIVQLLQTR
jgi:dienelactone hydrolase